jgi:3'-5' exoribonuclease 1
VARILQALVAKDVLVEANGKLPPLKNSKKWAWMGAPGEVNWEDWMSDNPRYSENAIPPNPATKAPAVPVVAGAAEADAAGGVITDEKAAKADGGKKAGTEVVEVEKEFAAVPEIELGPVVEVKA